MLTFFAWVSRFASVTEIIKYVEKLLIFACLVFSRTFCETVYKFQTSCFDELSFFPMTWSAVFSQLWRRSIFKFCGYKLAEAERFLKFKSEFIIIGRGCLVLLKFKFKLCKDYVLLVLNFLVLIRYPCVLNNYPSNIRTGNIGGLFRERSLTVLLSV